MPISIIVISVLFMLIGMGVQSRLKSRFAMYAKVPASSGLSGKAIAEKMLADNEIHDVKVVSVQGFLSDDYNPGNKTVNLSPDVYEGRNEYCHPEPASVGQTGLSKRRSCPIK